MNINIFAEENPADEALGKLRNLPFPTIVILAAHYLRQFLRHRERIEEINPKVKVAYWPTTPKSASCWLSPFCNPGDLLAILNEVKRYRGETPLIVMLDLELPLLNWKMFFRNISHFLSNLRTIERILRLGKTGRIKVYAAEWPALGRFSAWLKNLFGLSFPVSKYSHVRIPMLYSSMIHDFDRMIQSCWIGRFLRWIFLSNQSLWKNAIRQLKVETKTGRGNIWVGLGVTTPAQILGSESIIGPDELRLDLETVREIGGLDTVVVYHLNGLTPELQKVCQEFARGDSE